MSIRYVALLILLFGASQGCALMKKEKKPSFFAVGATEKQVVNVMGAPTQITLKDDTEYWHYGSSWVAWRHKKVCSFSNKGALRVQILDDHGNPAGFDSPEVLKPETKTQSLDLSPRRQKTSTEPLQSKITALENLVKPSPRNDSTDAIFQPVEQKPPPNNVHQTDGSQVDTRGTWLK